MKDEKALSQDCDSAPCFDLVVEQEEGKRIFRIKFPGKSVITVDE